MDELEKRKAEFLEKLKQLTKNPAYVIYALLTAIITIGTYIRTRNLSIIQWQFPIDPDSFAFLRYAKYVAENGHLMNIDMLRYYPLGWSNLSEFRILSYFIAYLYKFLHLFIPNITIQNTDVIYPVVTFAIGSVFFFLLVKKLFGWKVGLVSTAFLTVVPAYLYRTMAGSADKEALATMVMYAALYFFISAIKTKKLKWTVILSLISGVSSALAGSIWGGYIFVVLAIITLTFIMMLYGHLDKRSMIAYLLWFLAMGSILNIIYPERFYLDAFLTFNVMGLATFVFLSVMALYLSTSLRDKNPLITLQNKIKDKLNVELTLESLVIILMIILCIITLVLLYGPSNMINQIKEVYSELTEPFGTNRWALTVAEAHRPSFQDWVGQFSLRYLLITLAGATLAFYGMITGFKRKLGITALFAISLIAISISRYSPSSILDGSNTLSLMVYFVMGLGILAVLIFYPYIQAIRKRDTNTLELLKAIDKNKIFALAFLVYLMISAKTAIRLLFIFAPATTIFAGYFTIETFNKLKLLKNNTYKLIGIVALILLISVTWYGFAQSTLNQAQYTGSSYTYQWQQAMNWVKENTPKEAVFAHWWDYGYYVQTGGERATLSDGGNSRGAINYFIGRHLLTGQNETEALELLKANNATHFLVVYEEIGKYPAFSSIGSDKDYDRYSWITTFQLDPNMIQETRNETILVYTGSTALDEDFNYQDKLYPGGGAGVGAVLIPITTETVSENNQTRTIQQMKQPSIILAYQGQQLRVPLECVFINGQEKTFKEPGYPGCFMIIPSIEGNNQVNQLGAGLLLSPKVRRTVFTKLYLYEQPSDYFKKAYTDENTGMPLAIFQGRLIGPLKIWEISYPDNLNIPPEYYGTEEPAEVSVVGKQF